MTTALAIFGYNRPDHLRKCLEAVKRNKLIRIFIFIDGGYSEDVYKIACDFAKPINENVFGGCLVWASNRHRGCAKSIYHGIDTVFNHYAVDSIIVLEDDIIVSDNFIEYMLNGLEFYKDKKDIGSLTGYAMVENKEVYSAKRFTGWGWATWKDRWKKFNRNIEPFDSWGDDFPIMLDNA